MLNQVFLNCSIVTYLSKSTTEESRAAVLNLFDSLRSVALLKWFVSLCKLIQPGNIYQERWTALIGRAVDRKDSICKRMLLTWNTVTEMQSNMLGGGWVFMRNRHSLLVSIYTAAFSSLWWWSIMKDVIMLLLLSVICLWSGCDLAVIRNWHLKEAVETDEFMKHLLSRTCPLLIGCCCLCGTDWPGLYVVLTMVQVNPHCVELF